MFSLISDIIDNASKQPTELLLKNEHEKSSDILNIFYIVTFNLKI